MCRKATVPAVTAVWVVWTLLAGAGYAQGLPDWRHIGTYALDDPLVGSVSGPVDRIWQSSDRAILFVQTASGRTYQSSDLETWQTSAAQAPPVP